jgi:hypothetical protein
MKGVVQLVIGNWYKNSDGASLEIIALDKDEGVVEIQYFDGAVEELDMDSWFESGMTSIPPPEDWTGPFDDLEADDMGDTEKSATHPDEWSNPIDTLEWEDEIDLDGDY